MKPTTLEALLNAELRVNPSYQAPDTQVSISMELCRSLALVTGCLGLVSLLIALSTDFWFVVMGLGFSLHSGLWPKEFHQPVADYIHVTQSFSILAALCGLASVILLVLSRIPSLSIPRCGLLASSVTAFVAAIFVMVAMAVYTGERWDQPPHPQVQSFFSWSFYLGWVSMILFLCSGSVSLGAHCGAPWPGYDTL